MNTSLSERVSAAIKGLATGDAVGKQTEGLSRTDVLAWYPHGLSGFEGQPGTPIPRYVGNRRRQWLIGETTDDTECTMAVARAILRDLPFTHLTVGEELLKCEKGVHPGVTSYWEFHQTGNPARIDDNHNGCGAAIRVAPIGIAYTPQNEQHLIAAAHQASIPTHGRPLAIVAAIATASAMSAAVEGSTPDEVAACCVRMARVAEERWPPPNGNSISAAFAQTREDLLSRNELSPSTIAETHFPDRLLVIVPLALALATVTASAEISILLATNIGGDSDSVASIAGALAAAIRPDTVNDAWHRVVEDVNQHNLSTVAEALVRRRR